MEYNGFLHTEDLFLRRGEYWKINPSIVSNGILLEDIFPNVLNCISTQMREMLLGYLRDCQLSIANRN